jgi:hypothetical protein
MVVFSAHTVSVPDQQLSLRVKRKLDLSECFEDGDDTGIDQTDGNFTISRKLKKRWKISELKNRILNCKKGSFHKTQQPVWIDPAFRAEKRL